MQNSQKIVVACVLWLQQCIYYFRRAPHKSPVQEVTATATTAPKTILAFLGAPGSGKGTLAKRAVSDLHMMSLSTGDLCRAEVATGSEKGKMIAQCMQGGLIPDDVMTDMVDAWLAKNAGNAPIVLDGYPRTKAQAEKLAEFIKSKFPEYAFNVIYLLVSDEEEVVQRISGRLVCEVCKAIYNRSSLKDANSLKCEKCEGTLSRREDDREEVVRERMKTFAKNNDEIIAFYKNAGIPVKVLDVSHRTPEQIFEGFKQLLTEKGEQAAQPAQPHEQPTHAAL